MIVITRQQLDNAIAESFGDVGGTDEVWAALTRMSGAEPRTGPEHFAEAMRIMTGGLTTQSIARAHVHATLAVAAATAMAGTTLMPVHDYEAWQDVAGTPCPMGDRHEPADPDDRPPL